MSSGASEISAISIILISDLKYDTFLISYCIIEDMSCRRGETVFLRSASRSAAKVELLRETRFF